MEDVVHIKEVAIYPGAQDHVAKAGELTILDTYYVQNPDCRRVCNACPRRVLGVAAMEVEDFRLVDGGTKADPDSEEAGLKTLGGVPACFHTDRVIEVELDILPNQ